MTTEQKLVPCLEDVAERAMDRIRLALKDGDYFAARQVVVDMLAAAPAAPAQEPVGEVVEVFGDDCRVMLSSAWKALEGDKLYAAPVAPAPVAVKERGDAHD